jgi:hypothetical protein
VPTIEELRDSRKLADTLIKQKAIELYATFDKNERTGVRFGMFPAKKMEKAFAELAAVMEYPRYDNTDISRLLAVGIMDAANAGPDKMIA